MAKQTLQEKACQYLTSGKVRVVACGFGNAEFLVTGSDQYRVTFNENGWHCSCPARVPECAHLLAVKLISSYRASSAHAVTLPNQPTNELLTFEKPSAPSYEDEIEAFLNS